MDWWLILIIAVAAFLVVVAAYDLIQKKHAILRNYPIIGHFRFILERIGPELRQYIVTDNNEELPFSRDQRRWVYTTAKKENTYFGFGSDNPVGAAGQLVIRHSAFPKMAAATHDTPVPSAKVLGAWRAREHAFRPASIVNISAMSFGSLSGAAIQALNGGAAQAGCLHNTGEGAISDYHRSGGDLIYQIGTGYFGCRTPDGRFSMDDLLETVASSPVKAIELKLSQGAKPGLGGLLPAAKVTPEIAAARGVPVGITVASPACHTAFHDVPGLVEFVEDIAATTGLPVGIKSAVGQMRFWEDLSHHMASTERGPDFITVDGGEGGTGAAPLVFSDHVAYPFRTGMAKVYGAFVNEDIHKEIVFIGSGKLGFAENAMAAMTLGCDMINVAREAMMAVGCIQAQKCHTGHCPTGVATQNKRLARGLDPPSKSTRAANYIKAVRYDMLRIAHAAGVTHPALVPASDVEILGVNEPPVSIATNYGLSSDIERLHPADALAVDALMAPTPHQPRHEQGDVMSTETS